MSKPKGTIFERELLTTLKRFMDRKEIFMIKGPRQSGKTTLLHQLEEYLLGEKKVAKGRVIFINLEDRAILEKFNLSPKDFVKSYLDKKGRYFFLLDEYQYVVEGGQKLKFLYDSFADIKFIISGSSSLELTNETAKFLVGRAFSFYLYQLNFGEFVHAKNKRLFAYFQNKQTKIRKFLFDSQSFKQEEDIFLADLGKLFEEYVTWGGYPEVVKTQDERTKKEILQNIVTTYLERDIVSLLKIGDYLSFKNLGTLLAIQTGNLVNLNQLSNETKLYFEKLKKYLDILEGTFIIKLLKPFFINLATELKKNQKVYFLDSGLRNYLIDNFSAVELRPDKGHLIESVVLANLIYSLSQNCEFRFWRTLKGAEVDFVLKKGTRVFPIEVKYSHFNLPKISRGFRNFLSFYQPETALVATRNYWHKMNFQKTQIWFVPVFYL